MGKIHAVLDTINREQTETLLKQAGGVPLDRKAARRINQKLQSRVIGEKRRQPVMLKRTLALAAALVVLCCGTFSVFAAEEIAYQAAKIIDRLYQYVPDYGFVDTGEHIQFVLDEKVTAENEDILLSLNSAYVTNDGLTVMLTITRKNMSSEDFVRLKEEEIERHKQMDLEDSNPGGMPKMILSVNGASHGNAGAWTEYEDFSGVSSGGIEEQAVYTFALNGGALREDTQYRLFHPTHNLTLSFQLMAKDLQSPSELGATDVHNNISVTAVPVFSDERLEVSLFPINNSTYSIYSFTKEISIGSPGGQDLRLETESGEKAYETPGGYMGPNTKFAFPIEASDANFMLRIPFLMVQSQEYRNVRLRLPKKGEQLTLNLPVEFQDCVMTIVDAERRVAENIGDGDELKLTLRYENKAENQVMANASVSRLNFAGKMKSGTAWSYLSDESGVTREMYIALESGDIGSLHLQFNNPVYFLTDAYTLAFNR